MMGDQNVMLINFLQEQKKTIHKLNQTAPLRVLGSRDERVSH